VRVGLQAAQALLISGVAPQVGVLEVAHAGQELLGTVLGRSGGLALELEGAQVDEGLILGVLDVFVFEISQFRPSEPIGQLGPLGQLRPLGQVAHLQGLDGDLFGLLDPGALPQAHHLALPHGQIFLGPAVLEVVLGQVFGLVLVDVL
jgi:hypothetical protein